MNVTCLRKSSSKLKKNYTAISVNLQQKSFETRTFTRLGENETGKADLGRSILSKFTPGFYNSKSNINLITSRQQIISLSYHKFPTVSGN